MPFLLIIQHIHTAFYSPKLSLKTQTK